VILCHSSYSFRYGVLSPEQWVQLARAEQEPYLALTDINHTGAVLDFVRLAQEQDLKPIVGSHIKNGPHSLYTLLAQSNDGFHQINQWLSRHLMEGRPFPDRAPLLPETVAIYHFPHWPRRPLAGEEYLGLSQGDMQRRRWLRQPHEPEKLVVAQRVSFLQKRHYNAHRLLRSIACNCLLSKLPLAEKASPEEYYQRPAVRQAAFAERPDILKQSEALYQACQIHFEYKNYQTTHNKKHFGRDREEDRQRIHALCAQGMRERYKQPTPEVRERLERELAVIEKRGFFSYFLINHDLVQYARRKNYFYVGRGSGANSLVAYLLRITDVDPIALNLYFERFMNPSRKQPPDFDIDFSWRDRQDVTRYLFEKYPQAALLGAYNTFKPRAVTRELGKVLGLPPREIEALSRGSQAGNDDMSALVLRYRPYLENLPNLPTIHSSGILIPEKAISHYGSTWLPPKGFPTVHFDMYAAEDAGLHKFDILGQRGLGKIKDALQYIAHNQPDAHLADIHDVKPLWQDTKIKSLLREGRTMACFYVESPAMRGLLRKLKADSYLGLVAASSIIRPGVSQSGMMQEYIKRFREPQARRYIHPRMGEILAETFGVMVYQEDVLKVAHYFAGLSLEEADILRRGMSWKFRERNEFQTLKGRFFENCRERGYAEEVSSEVWRQIESFGNYAFSKGHSASYAVESYQSLYLKAYFPLEYLVATVNNGGGFYRAETYLNEARRHGAEVEAPCVNRSSKECRLDGAQLFLGFDFIKDMESRVVEELQRARREGPFGDLQDFTDRVALSLEQLTILIRVGAFRFTQMSKKQLLWQAHFLLGPARKSQPVPELFRQSEATPQLPELESLPYEDALDEMELLGFPLCSPFDLRQQYPEGLCLARELPHRVGQTVQMVGYLVHVKSLRTRGKKPRLMQFGCFTDAEGDFIDTVHFPDAAAQHPFKGMGLYLIQGVVSEEYDFVSVEVRYQEKLAYDRLPGSH